MAQQKDRPLDSEFFEKLVAVNRVTKVVKGGRQFTFTALIVVGDGNGRIGYGYGKAKEVPMAIQKAMDQAKKNLVQIILNNDTLQHPIVNVHGAAKVARAVEGERRVLGHGREGRDLRTIPVVAVFTAKSVYHSLFNLLTS